MREWIATYVVENQKILEIIFVPVLIIAGGLILIRVANALIDSLTKARLNRVSRPFDHNRIKTLESLLKNLVRYGLYFVMTVTVLDRLRVPVMAILSTAGVLGVAVAFGAQSLCRDIITGFFILFEDQYLVGEYIEAQGVAGYVEQFNLRCTYLRDFDGRLHILPNGGMTLVTNHHRGSCRVMVELTVSYEEDIGKVVAVLQEACDAVNEEFKEIIRDKITALGIVDLTAAGMVVRMMGKSQPMEQWGLERALRKKGKEALSAQGIAIAYPHTQVILEEKA
ncbi:MAG: mechanosensitive ion channel family protein [Clostridiales bacterium]